MNRMWPIILVIDYGGNTRIRMTSQKAITNGEAVEMLRIDGIQIGDEM